MFIDIPDEDAKDPWFKVVEFLRQNWAVVIGQNDFSLVVFYSDTCGIFDEISFDNDTDAETALRRNGFQKYLEDDRANEFIGLPRGDFRESPHPNGKIYSSGRYWTV